MRMNFLSRSSRPTGPKIRVPRGCFCSLMSTAAFSSKRVSSAAWWATPLTSRISATRPSPRIVEPTKQRRSLSTGWLGLTTISSLPTASSTMMPNRELEPRTTAKVSERLIVGSPPSLAGDSTHTGRATVGSETLPSPLGWSRTSRR